MRTEPLILLVDGNALIHRAFHALPPLTSSKTGEIVNAVYGFANTLLKVLSDLGATHWAVAFDYPAPTFRHKLYDGYKAQRPPTPEELIGQMGRIRELVTALGMPSFEVEGYEADDILGALSRQAHENGIEAAILSGDRDLLQLVGPGVKVLLPGRNFSDAVSYDESAVASKFGVTPQQFADYKAFVGDTSDNIPGVAGIGEKTAVNLLKQFGSMERVYDNADQVALKRARVALKSTRDQAMMSKELATIVTDVPVHLDLDECVVGNYSHETALALLRELDFASLFSRLPAAAGAAREPATPAPAPNRPTGRIVRSVEEQKHLVKRMLSSEAIVLSVADSNGGNGRRRTGKQSGELLAEYIAVAVSPAPGETYVLAVPPESPGPRAQMSLERPLEFMQPALEKQDAPKVCEDGKRVMRFLAERGIELKGLSFDLSIAAHLLGERTVRLSALAASRLGMSLDESAPSFDQGGAPTQQTADVLAADCDACRQLQEAFEPGLDAIGSGDLYRSVELPLVSILAAMETTGIIIDTGLLKKMSLELGKGLALLETQIYDAAGHRFNVNSPKQLGTVLFEELGLQGGRKTKSGYSTEASLLETLRPANPIVDLVLQYRQLAKLKSTYVDTLPALVNPHTGRVHTIFSQTGAATGRLSSSEPNLQNLPIRTEQGRQIRAAVVAPRGWQLLSADYSQIDLRSLAHLSGDEHLVDAFRKDEDIHAATASRLYGVAPGDVTPDMRRNAKVVNFGVVYGMSDFGLVQATDFNRAEASRFIDAYFAQYSGVSSWLEKTKQQARRDGYVTTLLGRRRYIADINAGNRQVREAAERMAINAPVQGTSADIIKVAMIKIYEAMLFRRLKSAMLLQIHDELLFEVPPDEFETLCQLVRDLMPTAVELTVPLKVDLKAGPNWADMKPVA